VPHFLLVNAPAPVACCWRDVRRRWQYGSIVIAAGRELLSSSGAFLERLMAVALEHQVGRAPNIDLGYHAVKITRLPSRNV
jgi:hypothetical protein